MKIVNATEVSLVKSIIDEYPAPGWLLAILGTFLTFIIIMTVICFKYCPRCTYGCAISCENATRGCSFCCILCGGCLKATAQNCIDCGETYKTCVDTTHECATYTPGQRNRRLPQPERIMVPQLPTSRL